MRKHSTTQQRSSSNPGRCIQDPDRNSLRIDSKRIQSIKSKDSNGGSQDTMIPKPRLRSFSSDRLSGMRKSNLRPTTGTKTSIGQYATASSFVSPVVTNRNNFIIEKSVKPSNTEQIYRGRSSNVDQPNVITKGYVTPKTTKFRNGIPASESRNRASSAERASTLVSKGIKKDSRQLNDKNFQNEMLNKIDNYFHSIGQSTILNSNGSVKPLTIKIFVEATNLLIKLLDMKSLLSTSNYVEEIPKIAKKLHYAGLMNKSWLKTANTMHSWPHAIGWISWLVELCEAKDLASETFILEKLPMIGASEEEKENRRSEFLIMIQCYKAWNEEKPDEEEKIIQQFFEDEAIKRGINATKFDQLQLELKQANENLTKEEVKNNKLDDEINELQQILRKLKENRTKQDEHILEQEKYIEKTSKNIEQLKKDSVIFTNDIKKLELVAEELNAVIKQQPMSVTERDKIVKVCSEQENYIQNFETHLEEMKKESYSLDMRLVSSNTSLVKTILAYNQALFMLSSDYNINIDELLMPEDGMCQSNFMNKLEDKQKLMTTFMQEHIQEMNRNLNLFEIFRKEKELLQTKQDNLLNQVEKKKATDEKYKQDLKLKQDKIQIEMKKLENNIAKLNNFNDERTSILDLTNQQLTDAIDKKEALLRKNKYMQEKAVEFFTNMYNILDEERFRIRKTLTEGYLENSTK